MPRTRRARFAGLARVCAIVGVMCLPMDAAAQSAGSLTVLRCEVEGRISYTNMGCPHADRVDAIRLPGLNRSTPPDRMAYHAPDDRRQEDSAPAWRASADAQASAIGPRVARFAPGANPECPHLAQRMALVEAEAQTATTHAFGLIQERLAVQRHWYRALGCARTEYVPGSRGAPAPSSPLPVHGYAG